MRNLSLSSKLATYTVTNGNWVKFYNDASVNQEGTEGAFADIEKAINEAQHFIFIAGWSFHPYMRLRHNLEPNEESTIGAFLIRKAHSCKNILVAIHTWDHTNLFVPDWANDWGGEILDILTQRIGVSKRKQKPSNLLWRASSRTDIGWSHHQKFVVLDAPGSKGRRVIKAFFGGLDLTKGRFDWSEHPILVPSQLTPVAFRELVKHFREQIEVIQPGWVSDSRVNYDDWYNAEFKDDRRLVRQAWHDIHAQLVGPSGWDFIREFVGRWNLDPSRWDAQGDDDRTSICRVLNVFCCLFDKRRFIQEWETGQGPWQAQVFRSIERRHWGARQIVETQGQKSKRREFIWTPEKDFESSISEAYQKAIDAAERFIYIETQYLIGSGKYWKRNTVENRIPELIVRRILKRSKEGPFHTYIVVPMLPEGDPTSGSVVAQRLFQWSTISWMVYVLHRLLGKKWSDYLSFYFLANWIHVDKLQFDGSRQDRVNSNNRYMVYVHSKLMLVDDRYIIVGSANLNERSLAGNRDSEIAVGFWPSGDEEQEEQCIQELRVFRRTLWQEHLKSLPPQFDKPESRECLEYVRETALQNYIAFRRGKRTTSQRGQLCLFPISMTKLNANKRCGVIFQSGAHDLQSRDMFIPDGLYNVISKRQRDLWLWMPDPHGTPIPGRTRWPE